MPYILCPMWKYVFEVHNDSVFVCILGENGDKIQEKFGILTSKLDKFRNLLIENAIGEVAITKYQSLSDTYLASSWKLFFTKVREFLLY